MHEPYVFVYVLSMTCSDAKNWCLAASPNLHFNKVTIYINIAQIQNASLCIITLIYYLQ